MPPYRRDGRAGRPLRVLHCPWNVAGQSAQLAAAQRELGADSRCIVIEEAALGFPADEVLAPPAPSITAREKARWRLLFRAIAWADVVQAMVEKGAEASSVEQAAIVAYLQKALPPQGSAGR